MGKRYALRVPRAVVDAMGWREGDDISMYAKGAKAIEPGDACYRDALIQRLLKYQGTLPAGFKFDREEANARR
ncbi:MAG: AbrB/MazE/SpoVT family DNA-binding domain-containing protein [Alphaproteobacteria bacterium]